GNRRLVRHQDRRRHLRDLRRVPGPGRSSGPPRRTDRRRPDEPGGRTAERSAGHQADRRSRGQAARLTRSPIRDALALRESAPGRGSRVTGWVRSALPVSAWRAGLEEFGAYFAVETHDASAAVRPPWVPLSTLLPGPEPQGAPAALRERIESVRLALAEASR